MSARPGIVLLFVALISPAHAARHIVVVEGLGGEERYTEAFADQVDKIEAASRALVPAGHLHALRGDDATRDAVRQRLAGLAGSATGDDELVLYLVGHGTFDDHVYKFNLPGPDLTGEELAESLDAHPAGRQLVVATGSASGALADLLDGERRTLVLATKSGRERHATTFGTWFAMALADGAADVDKNQAVSAGEAFRFAERRVRDYFEQNGQLATEHPEVAGDFADRFVLARLGGAPEAAGDPELAALHSERQRLTGEIEALRLARGDMPGDAYQSQLLSKMLELAKLEERIEARQEGGR